MGGSSPPGAIFMARNNDYQREVSINYLVSLAGERRRAEIERLYDERMEYYKAKLGNNGTLSFAHIVVQRDIKEKLKIKSTKR